LACLIALEPFVGNLRTGDIPAQALKLLALHQRHSAPPRARSKLCAWTQPDSVSRRLGWGRFAGSVLSVLLAVRVQCDRCRPPPASGVSALCESASAT